MDVLYICNRQMCANCSPMCDYTLDVRFAKNFELKEAPSDNNETIMYAVEKENDYER